MKKTRNGKRIFFAGTDACGNSVVIADSAIREAAIDIYSSERFPVLTRAQARRVAKVLLKFADEQPAKKG